MTVLVCPDCNGFEDRPDDLCGMCSDPGCFIPGEPCDHTVWERFNDGCACVDACDLCGAEREPNGLCWRCDIEDDEDRLNAASGLL